MASKKKLSELSPRSRALISVGATIQFALQGAALNDIRRRPSAQINGPKPLWAALTFVNFIGPIAYFLVGREKK